VCYYFPCPIWDGKALTSCVWEFESFFSDLENMQSFEFGCFEVLEFGDNLPNYGKALASSILESISV